MIASFDHEWGVAKAALKLITPSKQCFLHVINFRKEVIWGLRFKNLIDVFFSQAAI